MEEKIKEIIKKRNEKNKIMKDKINSLAEELFKQNPKILGLNITAILNNKRSLGHQSVQGLYIENKLKGGKK